MRILIKNALVYRNESRSFLPLDVLCEGERIIALFDRDISPKNEEKIFDAEGMAIIPGFVDVHTHGRSGFDFVSCKAQDLSVMANDYASCGVTTVMPTLASAPYDEMLGSAKIIRDFTPSKNEANFCGVHIEGRYLNPKKKGAHAEELLAPLFADELDNEIFSTLTALHISAAYELDESGEFARTAKRIGATLGLGHTNATFAQAKKAEENGITAYTHLFNAMPPLHHRDGGAVAACLLGDAYAELICDGIHIAPEVISLVYKCKGADKLVLISDSMEATGCQDGEYSIAGNPVTVKNGKALTHSGALAGSTLTLDEAVRNIMCFCDIPLTDAVLCATEAPAKEIGIFGECGSIDVGKRADMLFITPDETKLEIKKIMLRGIFKD